MFDLMFFSFSSPRCQKYYLFRLFSPQPFNLVLEIDGLAANRRHLVLGRSKLAGQVVVVALHTDEPLGEVLADPGVCAAAQFERKVDQATVQVGLSDLEGRGVDARS